VDGVQRGAVRVTAVELGDLCLAEAATFHGNAAGRAYLHRAAMHARDAIAAVPAYTPDHYPTIGWYYETRDRIVELMQARRLGRTVAA